MGWDGEIIPHLGIPYPHPIKFIGEWGGNGSEIFNGVGGFCHPQIEVIIRNFFLKNTRFQLKIQIDVIPNNGKSDLFIKISLTYSNSDKGQEFFMLQKSF